MMTTTSDLRPTDSVYLGARILKLRNDHGLKQTEIGRRMHLHPSIISLWEYDQRPVPRHRLDALAAALEVDIAILLRGVRIDSDPTGMLGGEPNVTVAAVLAPINPVVPQPLPALPSPPTPPTVPRSMVELRWCMHGGRRHHHGPVGTLRGPVVSLAEWA